MDKLFVSNKNQTVRMFESNCMEFFSHVHPATPVILYGPIIALMLYLAFVQKGLSFLTVLGFFVIGVLTKTAANGTLIMGGVTNRVAMACFS